jgi:regulatory subunit for Cdc7p protein kinase
MSVLKDLVMFKGPFIYIHDMDEKTKPVMVREYPKVARRQDGIWPQFRSAPLGKCPFIDEPPSKKEVERHRARQQEKERKAASKAAPLQQARTIKTNDLDQVTKERGDPDAGKEPSPIEAPKDAGSNLKQPETQNAQPAKPLSPRKSSESFIPPPPLNRNGPFYHGREPAASGVQPSNITSAIRSQMVSSTAAAPGAKAGVSKEVHELKRKVLEKSNGVVSAGTAPSSYRPANVSALKANRAQGNLPGKLNPAEKLGNVIEEDTTHSEGNETSKRRPSNNKAAPQKKRERRRDPKPGYCENCRDKFDDFEEVKHCIVLYRTAILTRWPARNDQKAPEVRHQQRELGRTGLLALPNPATSEGRIRILGTVQVNGEALPRRSRALTHFSVSYRYVHMRHYAYCFLHCGFDCT